MKTDFWALLICGTLMFFVRLFAGTAIAFWSDIAWWASAALLVFGWATYKLMMKFWIAKN
jgi:hypothetical protein